MAAIDFCRQILVFLVLTLFFPSFPMFLILEILLSLSLSQYQNLHESLGTSASQGKETSLDQQPHHFSATT